MSVYLKHIRIQRFRSIDSMDINFAPITIFVGENDSGKSNILKAINLFFNKEVVLDSPYDHKRDFSKITAKRQRKAEEVVIYVTLRPPFESKEYISRIDWRKYGIHKEHGIKNIKRYSKVPTWVERLNYRYVPANKENQYMKDLMRELYNLFATTIDKNIRVDTENFVANIRAQTSQITQEIKEALDLDSRIQLPQDLSSIFELLDFETNNEISINQRGDGIRVRHIPVMLNFLADYNNQAKGITRGNTIWGYEEPENNLEMAAAFKQAEQFVEYAKNIQILITTHSPAFYHLIQNEEICKGYYVQKDNENKTIITPIGENDNAKTDKFMGIMPIVTPYIQEKQKELEELEEILSEMQNAKWAADKKMLIVEGEFDKQVIDLCLNQSYSNEDISVIAAGGADKVKNIIQARVWGGTDYKNICIGLLDRDGKGKDIRENYYNSNHNPQNKLVLLNYPPIFSKIPHPQRHKLSFSLDHFFPINYWNIAEQKEWLEPSDFVNSNVNDLFSKEAAIAEIKKTYSHDVFIYIGHKITRTAKGDFKRFVINKMTNEGIPTELMEEIKRIVSIFEQNK